MSFSVSGLVKGLIVALVIVGLSYAGAKRFGFINGDVEPDSPAALAAEAMAALDAVKKRQPGDRRPASYDSVMAPLDKMLAQAKATLDSETYNPAGDMERLRALTLPVIDIATQAEAQARTETGPLAKTYRFADQIGEACYYLAAGLWERAGAGLQHPRSSLDERNQISAADANEIRRYLELGLEKAPDNRHLWYLRGLLYRAEGLFAPAAQDLERAVAIDGTYVAAWNTLGLVRIMLRDFEGAESALERARALALEEAKAANRPPGAEYLAIVYNLAAFHEGLAAYYNRENRVTPTVESRRLYTRHATEARKYYEEYLAQDPTAPDARQIRERLASLAK